MKLLNTIRIERAKMNITQKQLAEALEMCPQTIGNIEHGANPLLMTAYKIASYFGLKVQELFKLAEEGENEEN